MIEGRTVTIGDVAREAGVSLSSVSYALSGKRPISASTRERIQQAIDRLGYRPHAGARALASRRTDVLALMAPLRVDVNVSVILQFVAGVVTRARRHELDVLLLTNDDASSLERVASGSMVDGIIVMDVERDDPRLSALDALRQPAVLIGVPDDTRGRWCVDLDFESAGRDTVRRLHGGGVRRMALVGSPPTVVARRTSFAERLRRGWEDGVSGTGVEAAVVPSEASRAGGLRAVSDLLSGFPTVEALLVHNEGALPGVVEGLRQAGRGDVALTTIAPQDVATSLSVDCDWIDIPGARIGEAAVDMIISRLGGSTEPEVRLLPPLVRRHRAG